MKNIKNLFLVVAILATAGCSTNVITTNIQIPLTATEADTSIAPTLVSTPTAVPQPTMLPIQENNMYGIPGDAPMWLIIPFGRSDNQTAFNILVLGNDPNCQLTINTKTDFTGLSDQKDTIMLGAHTWNVLKTFQGTQQIDEIYYPDLYPQEYRDGGGVDGNGYSIRGFYSTCRLSIQTILARMP